MEYTHLVKDSNNPNVLAFSEALKNSKVGLGFENYYTSDASNVPFFKIPKAYKRENDNDPNTHYIFVDIDPVNGEGVEYSLFVTFSSEHFSSMDECISVIERLYFRELCEVAFVTPAVMLACIMENTGDSEQNVSRFAEKIAPIMSYIDEKVISSLGTGHIHMHFDASATGNILCQSPERFLIEGITSYLASSVFAEHPEYYVLQ